MTTRGARVLRRLVAVAAATVTVIAGTTSAASASFTFPRWTAHATIAPGLPIYSVSCPTAQWCGAMAGSYALRWNGLKWTKGPELPLYADPTISCPTITFCMAVGAGTDGTARGAAVRWNGKKWSHLNNIDAEGDYLTHVSCTSAKFCAAVDTVGNVLIWNGVVWSAPVAVGNSVMTAIACSSSSFCVAGDGFGAIFMYKNKIWRTAPAITGATPITSISCPTSKFCVAAGENSEGFAATWNGTKWSAMTHIDNEQTQSVSCPTTTYCVAVDDKGYDTVYNGKAWAPVRRIVEPIFFKSVSCPTIRFCMTVTADGTGLAYWTPLPKPTIALTDNAKQIRHGQTLIFTVKLTGRGRTPSGTVTWALAGPGAPTCHPSTLKLGKATCRIGNARHGRYTATAHYSGDPWYRPATAVDHAGVG